MRIASSIFVLLATGPLLAQPVQPARPGPPGQGIIKNKPKPTIADEVSATQTIKAASANAVKSLQAQIGAMPLGPKLTVAEFIKQLDVEDEFLATLRKADQIGGVRWINETTCQVRLEISAVRIVNALKQLAAAYPKASPVTPAQIDKAAADWPRGYFEAAASGAARVALNQMRPAVSEAWNAVSEEARQKALDEATADAAKRAMASVSAVQLSEKVTIADAFEQGAAGQTVKTWLASRPITRVDFKEDLSVEVELGVEDQELIDEIRSALSKLADLPLPKSAVEWQRIEGEIAHKLSAPIGQAKASAAPAVAVERADMPAKAPAWVRDVMDVTGEAAAGRNKLLTARAAEDVGRIRLRAQIEELKLDERTTIGAAAKKDKRIADAIARTVASARPYKTEYRPDGSARVKLQANMRELWELIGR